MVMGDIQAFGRMEKTAIMIVNSLTIFIGQFGFKIVYQ